MNLHIGMYPGNQMSVGNQMAIGNHPAGKNHHAVNSQTAGKNQGAVVKQMLWGSQAAGKSQKSMGSQNVFQMKQMLRNMNQQNSAQNLWGQKKSIVDEMTGYSDTLRLRREKAKYTSLEMKKLQYSYTSVSSRILRSKTSVSARQAAGQARREVLKLQRKRGNSEYDQEELEAAITHAKAMERLAKKKARHLEEEELAKVASPCLGEMKEEELRGEDEVQEDEKKLSELAEDEAAEEMTDAGMEDLTADDRAMEEISDAEIDSMAMEEMEAFLAEMQQSMQDLLEESGLNDLFEELNETPGGEMDPADYKMMKIKHRCKEMKDLVKADAEYLKVIFKKLEESRGKAIDGFKGAGGMGGGHISAGISSGGEMPSVTVHVDVSVADTGAGATGDAPTVDVSV